MTSFGLQIPNFRHAGGSVHTMFDDVCTHAIAAEASGFESVWVMDHFWQLPALGGPDEPILESYTLLGALAARRNGSGSARSSPASRTAIPRCSPRS